MQHHNAIGPIREMSWESIAEPLQLLANPSWDDAQAEIKGMETVESGSVFLKAKNGSALSIGGDRGRGYLVVYSDETGQRYLQPPALHRKGVISLAIGFQPAEYPRRIVVDLNAALKTAYRYFQAGRIQDCDEWTTDSKTVER